MSGTPSSELPRFGALNQAAANERLKITAAWLNTISTSLLVVGFFTPLATTLYGLATPGITKAEAILYSLCFVVVGLVAHLAARDLLKGVRG